MKKNACTKAVKQLLISATVIIFILMCLTGTALAEGSHTHTDADSDNFCDSCLYEIPLEEAKCGENITFRLYNDGRLVLSGSGDTYDYHHDMYTGVKTPFRKHSDFIKSVTIEEGITSIGDYIFSYCGSIESAVLSSTVMVLT